MRRRPGPRRRASRRDPAGRATRSRLMGRRRGGEVDVHAVLHRLRLRDGKDVDADGNGVGIGEAHGFNIGHAGFLAGNTAAEGARLRPEPADRGVIPGIHRNLNKPQRHAANPMLSWLIVMNRSRRGSYTTPVARQPFPGSGGVPGSDLIMKKAPGRGMGLESLP